MYAVIDVETTGLQVGHQHRVIEVGVVILDPQMRTVHEWQSLVNPKRDLGPTDIHGITASMVLDAPSFEDVAGDLQAILQGATPVGHFVRFDLGFLRSEFERACCEWPDVGGLCTMVMAERAGYPRSLGAACATLGIDHANAHTAIDDARASAAIFAALGGEYRDLGERDPWPAHEHPLTCTGRVLTRSATPSVPGGHYLERLLAALPPPTSARPGGAPESIIEYKGLLDRALEDRIIEGFEAVDLAGVATLWGLTADDVAEAHRDYLLEVATAALADGIVTNEERADLERVAILLGGLPGDVDHALNAAAAAPVVPRSQRLEGLSVCFTGTSMCEYAGALLSRADAEQLAREHGLVPQANATKKLDILVLADPDTQSGKATKARANGTRVIAERQFWAMLGVSVG